LKHFLLIYDRRRGVLIETREFQGAQRKEALRAQFDAEDAHRERPEIEVVVLGASSWDDIQRTHSRYFKSLDELMRPIVE
jgi:hypothetical protein